MILYIDVGLIYMLQGPWPVDVVFDRQTLGMYNKILRLLLGVSYVRWALIHLRIRNSGIDTLVKEIGRPTLSVYPVVSELFFPPFFCHRCKTGN